MEHIDRHETIPTTRANGDSQYNDPVKCMGGDTCVSICKTIDL